MDGKEEILRKFLNVAILLTIIVSTSFLYNKQELSDGTDYPSDFPSHIHTAWMGNGES